MDKSNQPKKSQEELWKEILLSSDNDAIIKLIEVLREKGSAKILPDIFRAYKKHKGSKIEKYIYSFLIDLKCKEAPDLIFNFILDKEFKSIKRDLLTLCWQINLDFSDFFDNFIDIFIECDLQIAFEAFTAMEYLENVDTKVIQKGIDKLQLSIDKIGIDKKELYVELVNILKKKI